MRLLLPSFLLFLSACANAPGGLPTEDKVRSLDAADLATPPPLYQILYDSAFLGDVQLAEQRTRILIWIRHMDLSAPQLRQLQLLHGRAKVLKERVERAQADIVQSFEPQLVPAYNAIFDGLREGRALDDPRMAAAASALLELRLHKSREDELLAMRMQSVRALLDEEQEFLRLLTPRQEALFADVLFVLRQSLDPAASPGDFHALVGTLFSAGEPTLLLHGDYARDRKPMNLGGLWSDESVEDLTAPVLHEARRELLLYLLLQEHALGEAIDAALIALGSPVGQPTPVAPAGAQPFKPPEGSTPPSPIQGQAIPAPPGTPLNP